MMNEKWMSLSINEVEKKLNTSAASGLSRKAARAHLQKAGENAFFLLPNTSMSDCARTVITQPSVILLLMISVLLIIFRQATQGRLILGLTLFYISILFLIHLWIGRIYRIPARTTRPQVRVIRDGQMFLLDCTRLIPGDLIELEQGDVASCDMRLIDAHNLRVLTFLGKANPKESYARTLKNASSDGLPYSNDICEHTNMVYGGSIIEQGSARALVVETGKHTYIGALQGGITLMPASTLPGKAEHMKKIASNLQIFLLLAILPIMSLILLIGKTDASLPILFSTLLCLCLANLSGHMDIILKFGMAIGVHRALSSGHSGEKALVKTDKSPDQITDFDELFLFGPQAFSEQDPMSEEGSGNAVALAGKAQEHERRRREMYTALGEHFLNGREIQIQQLREANIHPVLLIPEESSAAITYIMRTGVVEKSEEIALASHFRTRQLPITSGWGCYHAYCGFSNEELRSLMIFLQKSGKRIAVLGNTPHESSILKHADVRFTCVDDLSLFTDSHKAREKKPQLHRGIGSSATPRMRQYADVLIPCADRHHGGIASIVHMLYAAADTTHNLMNMARYLIYAQLLRIMFILPTTILGVQTIQPVQAVFSGFLLDLLIAVILLLRVGEHEPSNIRMVAHVSGRTTILEAICSASLTLVTFGWIHQNDADLLTAPHALFLAMLAIQLTYFLLCWNPLLALKNGTNRKISLYALAICPIFFLLAWLFGALSPLGFASLSAPYSYLVLVGPLSVILVAIVIRLYKSGRSR